MISDRVWDSASWLIFFLSWTFLSNTSLCMIFDRYIDPKSSKCDRSWDYYKVERQELGLLQSRKAGAGTITKSKGRSWDYYKVERQELGLLQNRKAGAGTSGRDQCCKQTGESRMFPFPSLAGSIYAGTNYHTASSVHRKAQATLFSLVNTPQLYTPRKNRFSKKLFRLMKLRLWKERIQHGRKQDISLVRRKCIKHSIGRHHLLLPLGGSGNLEQAV
jgi:hypothetical protein